MPHLSPMSWALMPIILFLILIMILSSIWWDISPKFKTQKSISYTQLFIPWKW